MTFHEPVPPEGTRCGDPRCGQPIVHGHPSTGWVRLYVAGVNQPAVWFSSLECMIYAVGVRPGLAPEPFIWPRNGHQFTLPEAVRLLNRYGSASLNVLNLTPIRVRYVYGRALYSLDMESEEALTVRSALAMARDVCLAECQPAATAGSPAPAEGDRASEG